MLSQVDLNKNRKGKHKVKLELGVMDCFKAKDYEGGGEIEGLGRTLGSWRMMVEKGSWE